MNAAAVQDYWGATLAFRARANAVLTVHAAEPTDDEWLASIGAVSVLQASHAMVSVVAVSLTPSAIPTTHQRTLVTSRVDHERVRIALLGGGTAMRMVVKAFSLFYPQTGAFSLDGMDAALSFAAVADTRLARRDLDDLAAHFGRTLPAASRDP